MALRLAARLRDLRERAGLTQEQLASQAEVAVSTVRKIETGAVVEPGYFTIMALLNVLGDTAEDIHPWPGAREDPADGDLGRGDGLDTCEHGD